MRATTKLLRRPVPTVAGLGAIVAGLGTLAGWVLDQQWLTDWDGNGICMQPNTAVCAVLVGIALLLLAASRPRLVTILGAFVGAVGAATLFEHVTAVDLGIDGLLLIPRTWGSFGTVVPGRMGLPASTCFALLGAALAVTRRGRRWRQVAALTGIAVSAIALLSVLGHFYGADLLYLVPTRTAIAIQSSIVLLLAGAGLVAALPDVQPMRTLVGYSAASVLARRALPFAILVPIAIGWWRMEGEVAGVYDSAYGTALRTIVECILLVGLLAWAASAVAKYERSLAESRARTEELMASISDHFQAVDHHGRHVYLNAALRRLLLTHGVAPVALLGHRLIDLYPELRDHPAVLDLLTALHDRTEREFEVEVVPWRRWFALRASPTPDGGLAIVSQDVTIRKTAEAEQQRLADELRQRMQELHAADRRKDEFLATLAHELRNPLAPIRNMLEVLKRSAGNADALQHARVIMERQLKHLTSLVDDLLDVSRIRTGRIALRKERVELGALVRHSLEGGMPAIETARHRLVVELPTEPLHVQGDAVRLAQVFGNLLDNACKYTEPGGTGLITVTVARQDDAATIRVRDNGVGIPPDMQARIFEMFTQVDRSLARAQEGLGIGLSLVRTLVEMHGGTVVAHSDGLGHGCEVTVRLPLATDAPTTATAPQAAPATGTCRILVVDDNRDAADSLARWLGLGGNTVATAADGFEAVQTAATFAPDVVLLDIGMPRLDGYEVARTLRAQARGQPPVLIAVTGHGQPQDRARTRDAGFDAHFVKPLDPEALTRRVFELLAARGTSDSATAGADAAPPHAVRGQPS